MHQSVIRALQGDGEVPTDFREFLDAQGTIYLLGKDSEVNTVAPLTTAIAEDLLDIAEAHALASPAGRLDPALLAALDEAPNIAPIPSLRQRVADGRGRGITVIYGVQGWASARARFGEDTANELASFTNHVVVFGGAKDLAFLKDMSDLCGHVERERTTKTTTGGDRGGHSTATHMALEPVLRGDEIRALANGHALVLADNLPLSSPVLTACGPGSPGPKSRIVSGSCGLPTRQSAHGRPQRRTNRPKLTPPRGPAERRRLSHDESACHFAPFPEPPELILEYIAARSTEEFVVDGPSPWDLGSLPAELIAPLPAWLDSVCRWLNWTYAWQPQDVIPPCWKKHEGLGYEIAALAFARTDAYVDGSTAVIWHEQYDRFLTRMTKTLGKSGDECRVGRHEDRPARFQLAAWPEEAAADADEVGSTKRVGEMA
ncbi:type IV secretory system conjugative DNA transfer family protein [Streptomyces sp. NPDC055094]